MSNSISEVFSRLDSYINTFYKDHNPNTARKAAEATCRIILISTGNADKASSQKMQLLIDSISQANTKINDFHIKKIKHDLRVIADYGNQESHDTEQNLNNDDILKLQESLNSLLVNVFDSKDIFFIDHKLPESIITRINRPILEKEDWRCDTIINLVYPNREYSYQKGKDFNFYKINDIDDRRIGVLFINRNVTFKQVFSNAYIEDNLKDLESLTVLFPIEISKTTGLPVKGRKENIERTSSEHLSKFNVQKCNYDYYEEFIWDKCLPPHIKQKKIKNKNKNESEIFVDQHLFNNKNELELSLDFVDKLAANKIKDRKPLYFIFGEGGVGKTTFCEQAMLSIDNMRDNNFKKKAILLSSQSIDENIQPQENIDSIQGLYSYLYKSDSEYIDLNALSLNISSGNIVIIIDGLDEIISKLKERFILNDFINSAIKLNDTYLNCTILIASREIAYKTLQTNSVEIMRLHGFDEELIEQYLKKAFREKNNPAKLVAKAKDQIKDICGDNSVTPLILRLICKLILDETNKTSSLTDSKYFRNGQGLDKIIYQLIDREIDKQQLEITCDQYFELLKTMAFEYGGRLSEEDLVDVATYIINEPEKFKSEQLWDSFILSPIFRKDNEKIIFRYDAFEFWVKARYISSLLNANQEIGDIVKDTSIFQTLKKTCYKGGALVREISIHRFKNTGNYEREIIKSITTNELNLNEIENRRLISALSYLHLEDSPHDKNERTNRIKHIYNYEKNNSILGLSIFGEFYPLDFSEVKKVCNGYFDSYTGLAKSNFPDAALIFEGCKFTNYTENDLKGITLKVDNLGNSCVVCDELKNTLNIKNEINKNKKKNIEKALKRILKVGFKISDGQFIWRSFDLYKQSCNTIDINLKLSAILDLLCNKNLLKKEENNLDGIHGYIVPQAKALEVKEFISQSIKSDCIVSVIDELNELR